MGRDATANPDALRERERRYEVRSLEVGYFRLAGSGLPPPPNGFGGTTAPFSPGGAALAAGFGFADPVGVGFALPPGTATPGTTGAGAGVATAAGTGDAGGGAGGAVAGPPAAPTVAAALGPGFAAAPLSSLALTMIAPAVPTTTHTPRRTRHTRRPMLAFVDAPGSGYETRDGEVGRAGAAPVKT